MPTGPRPLERRLGPWFHEQDKDEAKILFSPARGGQLSHNSVQYLVAKYANPAARACPTLCRKPVTPHVLRHTTAMGRLQAGMDRSVIALWLGHKSVETTQIYLDAKLALKEDAVKKTSPVNCRSRQADSRLEG